MGEGGSAGGGRATRALRLLLLLVLALAAVEYLFGSILEASSLRTYLYSPMYNARQTTLKKAERSPDSLKKFPSTNALSQAQNFTRNNHTMINNVLRYPIKFNITKEKPSDMNINVSLSNEFTPTSMLISKIVEVIKNDSQVVIMSDSTSAILPVCESMSDLGPAPVNTTDIGLDEVEKKFPEVQWGGRYTPPNCTAKQKVAIIVPFRDRQRHLAIFLNHMHPFLMKQQLDYGIYIVEQKGSKQFNRAKLMNVGFMESQKLEPGGFQCFIFHDVDLLPLDARNLYSCTRQPRHMSASIDKYKFKLPYNTIFGGVSAMTLEQFQTVNGFSNKYWGWGSEDDDMYYRLLKKNYHIARYKMSIARYASLKHKRAKPNPKRYQLVSQKGKMLGRDGLSTLKYEIAQVMQYHLYTYILANIDDAADGHISPNSCLAMTGYPYSEIFGGVSALTLEQMQAVNGFSNNYWGWGGEDDDMYYRYHLLSYEGNTFDKDGLSTLKYDIAQVTKHHLYTNIITNIDECSCWAYFSKLFFGDDLQGAAPPRRMLSTATQRILAACVNLFDNVGLRFHWSTYTKTHDYV